MNGHDPTCACASCEMIRHEQAVADALTADERPSPSSPGWGLIVAIHQAQDEGVRSRYRTRRTT